MNFTYTKTIEITLEVKKEICPVYNKTIENVYVNGQSIAKIRFIKDRHERNWYEATTAEKFYFDSNCYSSKDLGLELRSRLYTTKKAIYSDVQHAIKLKLSKIK